ncbi:MAG: hypothetical protein HY094_05395 [Candidatus Melainabacteria bacterium]|nr:hypothetical protein [Candidatus Melainabacteria bacterium]
MIRNYKKYREFEENFISKEKIDFARNFFLFEEMYKEAVTLGVLPIKNPLEDIDLAIKTANILNSVPKTNSNNS